jgi:hypothetical protein
MGRIVAMYVVLSKWPQARQRLAPFQQVQPGITAIETTLLSLQVLMLRYS